MKTSLENIVGEARELFRTHGYAGMSMQDLADRVGLKKPSLYTRFASKEALVPEVLALTIAETFADLPDPAADWRAAYRAVIERIAAVLTERKRCVGGHLALGVSAETPVAQASVRDFFNALRDGVAATLAPAFPQAQAREIAMDAVARLEGASVWLAATNDPAAMERAVAALIAEAESAAKPSKKPRTTYIVDKINYPHKASTMETVIAAVRQFNRFYTQRIGALDARFLGSDMSLVEARLLFEIVHAEEPVAADLQATLNMDAGYLSRTLSRFETAGWIVRGRGIDDARRRPIRLTDTGRAVFASLDARQRAEVEAMLAPLDDTERGDLVKSLGTARQLLGGPPSAYAIRAFRSGDMGLIASRQSILYREVYGWGTPMEAIIGETTVAFLRNHVPGRSQCWVAEIDGVMAGSIFLTDEGSGLCRLRLFYVEPFARRRGIGKALVETCLAFARDAGYTAMTLWTHTILDGARHIYAQHGFELIETKVHHDFGEPAQGETWRLDLTRA